MRERERIEMDEKLLGSKDSNKGQKFWRPLLPFSLSLFSLSLSVSLSLSLCVSLIQSERDSLLFRKLCFLSIHSPMMFTHGEVKVRLSLSSGSRFR